MKCWILVLAGLLAWDSASAQALDLKKKARKKRPPPDPAVVWPYRWYLGASVHQAGFGEGWATAEKTDDGSFASAESDDTATGYSIYGGLEFKQTIALALELGYVALGTVTYTAQSDGSGPVWAAGPVREEMEMTGRMLAGQAAYPVGHGLSLCARLGVLAWKSQAVYGGTTQGGPVTNGGSRSNVGPAFGAGVVFDGLEDWRLRASYMRYVLSDASSDVQLADLKSKVNQLELSVAYRF